MFVISKREFYMGFSKNPVLVTFRKRSCGKVMFLYLSVILFTGGVYTLPLADTPHPPGRHPPRHPPPQANPPPPRQPLQLTVRILLECILVNIIFASRAGKCLDGWSVHYHNRSQVQSYQCCMYMYKYVDQY